MASSIALSTTSVDEVVQTARTGGADVHAGTLADRLEPLEHLDVAGVVCSCALLGPGCQRASDRRCSTRRNLPTRNATTCRWGACEGRSHERCHLTAARPTPDREPGTEKQPSTWDFAPRCGPGAPGRRRAPRRPCGGSPRAGTSPGRPTARSRPRRSGRRRRRRPGAVSAARRSPTISGQRRGELGDRHAAAEDLLAHEPVDDVGDRDHLVRTRGDDDRRSPWRRASAVSRWHHAAPARAVTAPARTSHTARADAGHVGLVGHRDEHLARRERRGARGTGRVARDRAR